MNTYLRWALVNVHAMKCRHCHIYGKPVTKLKPRAARNSGSSMTLRQRLGNSGVVIQDKSTVMVVGEAGHVLDTQDS